MDSCFKCITCGFHFYNNDGHKNIIKLHYEQHNAYLNRINMIDQRKNHLNILLNFTRECNFSDISLNIVKKSYNMFILSLNNDWKEIEISDKGLELIINVYKNTNNFTIAYREYNLLRSNCPFW